MRRILLSIFIFIIILSIYPNQAYSTSISMGDILEDGDGFISSAEDSKIKDEDIRPISNTIYNIFFTIGVSVAVIVGAVLGIQFMVGSIEAKAKVQDALIPFVIGCVVVFGSFAIWKIVIEIGNQIAT